MGSDTPGWLTVVGVVENVRTFSLENQENTPTHYVSARQRPARIGATTVIARTQQDADSIRPQLQRALDAVDPDLAATTSTVEDLIHETTLERRQAMLVLTVFAAIALLLSGIGIYGVLSYEVAVRTREIGIRLALGSPRALVVRGMLAHLGLPVALGLVVGLAGARASSGVLTVLVFGVTPTDPAVLSVACGAILLLAAAATYLPARRAVRVDPMISLRGD
jgi:putative ABC transport system permease protein